MDMAAVAAAVAIAKKIPDTAVGDATAAAERAEAAAASAQEYGYRIVVNNHTLTITSEED